MAISVTQYGNSMLDQLQMQDKAARLLAKAIGGFLRSAFGRSVDPSVIVLEECIAGFLCCGYDQQIKGLEAQQKQIAEMQARGHNFGPWKPTLEALADLCAKRDKLAEMIETAENAMDSMGKADDDPAVALMRIGLQPSKEQLEGIEKQISEWQRILEAE